MLKKLTLNKWHRVSVVVVYLLLFPDTIYAESKYSNLKLTGFIMQSYIKTDNNNFFGKSIGQGSFDYTEIGVNGSFRVSPKLQLASQLLFRRAGETDKGKVKLDFALADYRLIDKFDYGLGFRVGRVKNPLGFYNETRDVSFTRENIILPQSIYFDRTRDVSVSSDGVNIYSHKQMSLGVMNAQLVVAMPRVTDVSTEFALLGDSKAGKFVAKPSFTGRLKFETSDSRITAALSHVSLYMDYVPADSEPGFPDGDGEIHFRMNIFSVRYNLQSWSFTGEYAQRNIRATGIIYIPEPANNKMGESAYLQTVYRFNHKLSVIGRYDVLFADKKDRDGKIFAEALSAFGVKDYTRYAKDTMLGVQYNFNRYWMTRFEVHSIDGTAWLPKQDNLLTSEIERKWRMINASLSYRF